MENNGTQDPISDNNQVLLQTLDQIFTGKKRLLVVMHDYPDPDAIASAFALKFFVESRYGVKVRMAYGGAIQRAENLALVKELKIKLSQIARVRFHSYDCIAMVDTQPGAGNNALPNDVHCDLVIDHHPKTRKFHAGLEMIDPSIGASATILAELLCLAKLPFQSNMATALTYAIRTETQELGRETSKRDIKAYLSVYGQSSMKKLYRIAYPKLSHSYFQMLARGLIRAKYYRNLMALNLEDVDHPEIVAELADILLRRKHTTWVLCTGRYQEQLFISIRSSNPNARAGKLISRLVKNKKDSGGHDTFAGGKISIAKMEQQQIQAIESGLMTDFAKKLGYAQADWKFLTEKEASDPELKTKVKASH